MSTTAADPLHEWFRKIGTTLNNEDYEAGIHALTAHDAEVSAKALEDAADALDKLVDLTDATDAGMIAYSVRARAARVREGAK